MGEGTIWMSGKNGHQIEETDCGDGSTEAIN